MTNLKPDKPDKTPPIIVRLSLRGVDWRQPSVISLMLANLIPVFGVLFLDWQVFPLMFLFWSENLVIGGFNILKMLANRISSPAGWAAKCFLIPFFCVHYGMFTFIHGLFVITLFGGGFQGGEDFPNPVDFLLGDFWRIAKENALGLALLGLVASHGVSFVTNYIRKGEYQRVDLGDLMFRPYARIVVMQLVIILGGFLMMSLHSPMPGLLLLVFLKILLDLRAHAGERKSSQKPSAPKKRRQS
jgi:hypothetical protein